MTDQQIVREADPATGKWSYRAQAEASGGGGSSALRVLKATVGFADFSEVGEGIGRTGILYSLQPGEQLVLVAARVTETFDDSGGASLYVSSTEVGEFGNLVGLPGYGPEAFTNHDGLVYLVSADGAPTLYSDGDLSFKTPVEPFDAAIDLRVFANPMVFDGTQGIFEVTFHVATPEAI